MQRNPFAPTYVSGIQISKNGPMKLRFYDGTERLSTKGSGYAQLSELLVDKLKALNKSVDD